MRSSTSATWSTTSTRRSPSTPSCSTSSCSPARPRRSPTSGAGTSGCCSPGPRARRGARCPTASHPAPAAGTASIGWHESGRHLVLWGTLDHPDAPDNVSVIGCDGANGTYSYLDTDERGVCRIFELRVGDGVWQFERAGEPFDQRLTWTLGDDGDTIVARVEMAEAGEYRLDFDMVYRRVGT